MKDQEDYAGVLNVLLLPGGGPLAWITQNRKILLLFLLLSPSTKKLQLVAKNVLTLFVDGATIVVLHISTRVEVIQTELITSFIFLFQSIIVHQICYNGQILEFRVS